MPSNHKFTGDNLNESTDYSSINSSYRISSPLVPDSLASKACDCRLGMTIDDPRLRRIPCRSKHITYLHVKELHKELSTFDVYGKIHETICFIPDNFILFEFSILHDQLIKLD